MLRKIWKIAELEFVEERRLSLVLFSLFSFLSSGAVDYFFFGPALSGHVDL